MTEKEKKRGGYQYSEPPIKRHFDFPKELNDRLVEATRVRNKAAVRIVQDAIEAYLGDPDAPPYDVRLTIRETVAEVLQEAAAKGTFGGIKHYRPQMMDNRADTVILKLLAAPPCGPWKEAIEEAEDFPMTPQMASELGVQPNDFLVRADGDSMAEAGIPDGSILLMRPLNGARPKRGEVALVQVETSDGEWVGTIKHWFQAKSRAVDLRDGRGMPYALPVNVRAVHPVAVKVGLISRG